MNSSLAKDQAGTEPKKVGAIIQARMTSSRLPGKSMLQLDGLPVLGWVARAVNAAQEVEQVVVATSSDESDDAIASFCQSEGILVYRGSLDDVLDRFIGAIDEHPVDAVARVTADCPLLDPAVIDKAVAKWRQDPNVDYVSTTLKRSLPRGLDAEVAAVGALREAAANATGTDRSHVTSYLYRVPDRFKTEGFVFEPDASDLRVTLDTEEDLELISRIAHDLGNRIISLEELIGYLRANPEVAALNSEVRQKTLDES